MNLSRLEKRLSNLKKITKASDRTGWMVDENAFLLYSLVKFYKPAYIIQIGHLWGKSALFLLEALTDGLLLGDKRIETGILSGDKKFFSFIKTKWPKVLKSKLVSVDAFPYGDWKKGISYLEKTYGKDRFEFVVEKSQDFFKERGKKIKKNFKNKVILGIVDGDHSYEACLMDIEGMADLEVSHIIVDDILWLPHILKACKKFVTKNPNYELSTFKAYNGLAVLSKK